MRYCIINARVITPFEERPGCVIVEDGKIIDVSDRAEIPEGAEVIDAMGRVLCPGFIEIHAHGGGGYEMLDGTTESIVAMANAHALNGTTTMLPTTLSATVAQTERALDAAAQAMTSADVLATIGGVHLEGPYLNPAQAGAQQPELILVPNKNDWHWMLRHEQIIRMVGIAPELEGAFDMADAFRDRGIPVTVAHSNATFPTVQEAVRHGFCDVTHIYSGCSLVTRVKGFRVGGVVEAGLTIDELTVQMIADGCHLPPELIRLIYRCKGAENIELITDALRYAAAGLEDGAVVTDSVGLQMIYKDGVMKLMDETAFAGSVATSDRLVRTVHAAGIPLKDAVRMATDTPARRVGLTQKGRIAKGFDADLVLLDDALATCWVMAKGRIIRDDLPKEA